MMCTHALTRPKILTYTRTHGHTGAQSSVNMQIMIYLLLQRYFNYAQRLQQQQVCYCKEAFSLTAAVIGNCTHIHLHIHKYNKYDLIRYAFIRFRELLLTYLCFQRLRQCCHLL